MNKAIQSLFLITIFSGIALSSSIVSADDNTSVVDEINITVPISCTISGTGQNSHNANINNGLYVDDIGSTILHAFCNDNEGFAIYAAGYTGDEVEGENSNKLVGTTASNNATIESGTATTAGNPDISNWAMKLAITQDSGDTTSTNAFTIDSAPNVSLPSQAESGATQVSFSNYHVVPNEYVKVAHKNSGTDMTETTGGVKLTTTYAAYISKTQAADTYSGQVIYTLVHPASANAPFVPIRCGQGKICYNSNGNDVLGTMGEQDIPRARDWSSCYETDNESYCIDEEGYGVSVDALPYLDGYAETVTLHASNFKREGYGFAGWNDSYDMTGANYGPNQTISISQDMASNGVSLYAHWVESNGNLQDWTGCGTLNSNQVIGLTDTRDGNVYAVSKLADGNCWMIEDLRLSNSNSTLDNTNTDNPAPGFTSLSASSDDNWDCNTEACINQNKLNANNTILFVNNTTGVQNGYIYSYGNYYNWYTATAGTGTYSLISDNATGSICANGWTLPLGKKSNNDEGQFATLGSALGITSYGIYTADGSNRMRTYPNNFIFNDGYLGGYWSRTAYGMKEANYMLISNMYIYYNAGNGRGKHNGYYVRCLTSGL